MDEMVAMMKSINATHTFDLSLLDNVQDLDGETYKPTIFFDFDAYVRQLCTNDNDAYEQFHNVLLRQFIMFDDCYMSSMEVAYDLKDVTDYIIASTSEVMAYGMPYEKVE